MDEKETRAYVAALEERHMELNKKEQRKRLITNFLIGCLPGALFAIWWLWIR